MSLIYCRECGKQHSANVSFCSECGTRVASKIAAKVVPAPVPAQASPIMNNGYSRPGCPRCGNTFISYQTVAEPIKTGCGTILLYIILALTIFGLLIVIPLMLRKKTVTVTYAVCQGCGYRWRV